MLCDRENDANLGDRSHPIGMFHHIPLNNPVCQGCPRTYFAGKGEEFAGPANRLLTTSSFLTVRYSTSIAMHKHEFSSSSTTTTTTTTHHKLILQSSLSFSTPPLAPGAFRGGDAASGVVGITRK